VSALAEAAALYRGELDLGLDRRGDGRTVARSQYHRGALRVLRPLYLDATGQVTYVVVNPGGACLDGDRYRIDVTLDDGADLLLTTQSATKVYRTPREGAVQEARFVLGRGSRLEYLPDQLIAYRGSRYEQDTRVEMDPTAGLVMGEVVTPGWSPSGAPFGYRELRLRTEVAMGGRPVVVDSIVLDPSDGAGGLGALGLLEGHSHLGSLLVVDPRADQDAVDAVRGLLADRPALRGGVSALAVPGFTMRVLGPSTEGVEGVIRSAVDGLRARWGGQGRVDLRKY
jgi:urease accessory protein